VSTSAFNLIYRILKAILPWAITAIALVAICRDLDWKVFFAHASDIAPGWFICSLAMLLLSYPFRAIRWRAMFPGNAPTFVGSYKALILGFFMNNILPARAGEIVRAHAGSKFFNTTRTTVLATIAGERLVDGLTISFIFLVFGTKVDANGHLYRALVYACSLFGAVGLGVLLTVILKKQIFSLLRRIATKKAHIKAIAYTCSRALCYLHSMFRSPWHSKHFTWSLIILARLSRQLLADSALSKQSEVQYSLPLAGFKKNPLSQSYFQRIYCNIS
jgi:hypothetical protein